MNECDGVECIESRGRLICDVEDGHKAGTVRNRANMSLRFKRHSLGTRQGIGDRRQGSSGSLRQTLPGAVGQGAAERQAWLLEMVDGAGFEPATPALRTPCSPS